MSEIALPSFAPEPRCHVCRTDSVREKVNQMLVNGSSYAQIVRAVGAEGTEALSLDSVRNHANRHFPVQNAAQATFREIVERRAAANEIDFVAGVGTAITPLAFYESLMVKSFGKLVQEDTEISIETGLRAAEKLQAVMSSRDFAADVARMRTEVGRITEAVKTTVTPEMMAKISAKIDVLAGRVKDPDDVDDDAEDDDDIPFDPGDDSDDDDDF